MTTRLTSPLLFLAMTAVLACACAWLLGQHYVNPEASFRWASILGVFDAEEVRLEHLGLIYPHIPYYLLAPFTFLPGLRDAAAPYFLSAVLGAALLALWNRHLRAAGISPALRLTFICLVAVHPAFLWSATNGGHVIFGLFMFYALYRACLRMLIDQDVRSFIVLALVLAAYFFVDEVAFYLFIALVPLLALIAPRRMLLESPTSVYAMILVPLAIALAAWVYMNWIFHGDPWTFVRTPWSAFLGNWQYAQHLPWLRAHGGAFLMPALIALLLIATSYPLIAYLLWHLSDDPARLRAAVVLLLHPVIAVGFATANFFLGHPLEMTVLVIGGLMAELSHLDPAHARRGFTLSALLALGVAGGWASFFSGPTPDMLHWRQTLLGEAHTVPASGARELGAWLAANRQATLIDHRSAYAAIAARGDARGLWLPFSNRFKTELRLGTPTIEQIVVPDPESDLGKLDMINTRHPRAYNRGFDGYRLAYDRDGWRVYRRR